MLRYWDPRLKNGTPPCMSYPIGFHCNIPTNINTWTCSTMSPTWSQNRFLTKRTKNFLIALPFFYGELNSCFVYLWIFLSYIWIYVKMLMMETYSSAKKSSYDQYNVLDIEYRRKTSAFCVFYSWFLPASASSKFWLKTNKSI